MSYEKEKLGKYVDVQSGYAFKSKDFVDSGIPIIKIKNITPPSVSLEELSYVNSDVAKSHMDYLLHYDDVLIALTGSHINQMNSVVGRVARVKYSDATLLNQRVGRIKVINTDLCDLDFVYYFLSQQSTQIRLASNAGGAANQANISPGDIKNLLVTFPDIHTQKRMASIFCAYDDLIENSQKQIKLLEEVAQRLYKEWFVDLRFPGYENAKIVDGVPEGWMIAGLGELAPILTGKKDANFGTKDGKYPFFTCAQEPIKAPSYSFECSAVILAGNGDFNVKLYRGKFEAYQRTYVFSPNNEEDLYLIFHAVRENMRNLFQGASGSTIKFLTKGMLENIKVFQPSEEIVEQFNEYNETIQDKVELLKRDVVLATEARDRLLPKLMSGEIEL